MGTISYTDLFRYFMVPGQTPSITYLNTAFSTVSTAVANLDRDNFRKNAGFRNAQKSSPYSVVMMSVTIPSFTYTDTTGEFYVNLFAYPHSTTVNTGSTVYLPSIKKEQLAEPFTLVQGQVVYDDISGHDTGDLISMVVRYVPASVKEPVWSISTATAGTINAYAKNTIHTNAYSLEDVTACVAQMRVVPNGSTAGTRTVTRWTGTLTMKVKHVG